MAYTLTYSYIDADNAYSVSGHTGEPDTVIIPSTHNELPVISINNGAFRDCSSLTSVTFGENSQLNSIGNRAFYNCSKLTSIEIPSSVTSIGDNAFDNCRRLTSVTFGENSRLTSIGSEAFAYCTSLTSIEIPSSVTSIGGSAFVWCSLTSIEIPSRVTSIGSEAFRYCTTLTSITINATTPPSLVDANAFNNTNNCPIYVRRNSVNAYKTATEWSNLANRIQEMPHKAVDFESLATYDTNIKQYISEHGGGGGGAVDSVNGKTGVVVLSAQDVGALADTTKYGASIEFIVDTTTFILTARLKDQDGNVLGTEQTVDLPLESVVVDGSYDSATREVVLTLQSGSKIRFSVADLVSGLQTKITAQNKLNADFVNDASSTNKFVTNTEKTAISEAIKYSYQSLTDAQREQARKNIRAIGFITLRYSATLDYFLTTYRNTAYYVLFDGADVYYTVFVGHSDSGYYFEIESTSSKVRYVGAGVGNLTFTQAMSDAYRQDYALTSEIITSLSRLTQDSTHRTVTDAQIATWNAKQNSPVVKTGTLSPRSSTVADFVGQFYLNTTYGTLFQCIEISNGTYTWKEIDEEVTPQSTPIYSHRVEASNGEAKLIIQFYSTTEAFGDVLEFNDFLGDQQRTITGYYKNSSGNYQTLYTVQRGLFDDAIAFYFYANGVEPTFNMLTDITTFYDYSDQI